MRTSLHAVLLAIAGLMFTPLAQALGTSELLDVVIQAVEPQLQPAKPLILCILDGKNVQKCIEQEIENQAAALQQEGKNQLPRRCPLIRMTAASRRSSLSSRRRARASGST